MEPRLAYRPFFTGIAECVTVPTREQAVAFLQERITTRRRGFIEEYRQKEKGSAALTYEPALDREVYRELQRHRLEHTQAYQEVLSGLNTYTKFQVETFIGERLNVGLSHFRYDIRFNEQGQGILHGQGMDEPLIPMIARGRDTRSFVGEDIDRPRQEAEVIQFQKIQGVLGDAKTPFGTTILSFSPPGKEGSAYSHNFYDVFVLRQDEQTKERFVEARRYASGLSLEESLKKTEVLKPGYTQDLSEETPVDAYIISRPIVLGEGHELFDRPDELHRSLQADPKAMSYEDFQQKVVGDSLFGEMVGEYLQVLEDNPQNEQLLDRILNAVMNRADEVAGLRNATRVQTLARRHGSHPMPPIPLIDHINQYGTQQVRSTTTGCGASGGFGQESRFGGYGTSRIPGNMSPFKSSDVASGEDNYGKRTFDCPECHQTNTRPYNTLLPACQHCGSTKVAC